jgi:prephenate dehydrogenase
MTIQITILGLGQVGASFGLALADKKNSILRVGNDREPEVCKRAQKIGAVDQIQFNLPSAVRKADVVMLCMPVDEIQNTLEAISQDLKEGCVVVDTSPVKIGVAQWAEKLLPKDRHFVTMTPTINPAYLVEAEVGISAAHADLFKNSLMVITNQPDVESDVLKLAADLAVLVGSAPFFADPYEVDGLMAAVHLLPELLAVALVDATVNQPGWIEARKVAGRAYARASLPLLEPSETDFHGQAALLNKQNILRVMDNAIASMRALRETIAEGDEKGLADIMRNAIKARDEWQAQRQKANWDMVPAQDLPTAGEIMGRLVGLGRKPKKS